MNFKIWTSIILGTYKAAGHYGEALIKGGVQCDGFTEDVLRKMPISQTITPEDLVILHPIEFGFSLFAPYDAFCNKVEELGPKHCPAEVGPALRLDYPPSHDEPWLYIAMNPIFDRRNYPRIFMVGRDVEGRWLSTSYGALNYLWPVCTPFIFILPRKQ